jgi:hypothetical protein
MDLDKIIIKKFLDFKNYHQTMSKRRTPKYATRCDKVYVKWTNGGGAWSNPDKCPYKDNCFNCHTEEEFINHPSNKKKSSKLLNNPIGQVNFIFEIIWLK